MLTCQALERLQTDARAHTCKTRGSCKACVSGHACLARQACLSSLACTHIGIATCLYGSHVTRITQSVERSLRIDHMFTCQTLEEVRSRSESTDL